LIISIYKHSHICCKHHVIFTLLQFSRCFYPKQHTNVNLNRQ
jgi:hypothetical protein